MTDSAPLLASQIVVSVCLLLFAAIAMVGVAVGARRSGC
jgi:hypothetical protein